MTSIVSYPCDENMVSNIKEWNYGTNWPVVYIWYNDKKAYVGETLDAVRRTKEHIAEKEFDEFKNICLISDKTFNKSVILDLEAFLIKYMGADQAITLTNSNPGVDDHNYFYKEAYADDFKVIWQQLLGKGIVTETLQEIENSELFKYSPYKTLNDEQKNAVYDILGRLSQINNATKQSLIKVIGGAGTGKTILAVYLVKLLVDISLGKNVWRSIDSPEDELFLQKISQKLYGIKKIGFVVPMRELNTTMKVVFDSIDGLNKSMILFPEEVVSSQYDLLIVDEAHRLYWRKNLPMAQTANRYDELNRQLMGDELTKTEKDLTELDWIIRSSRLQVLFYDECQRIRITDISKERFETICAPITYRTIELVSQMRCKGGNGYYEYVKSILESSNLSMRYYKSFTYYETKVVDSIEDLFEIIRDHNEDSENEKLSKVVTGPGWTSTQDIEIDGIKYKWASGRRDKRDNVIFSIHKVQGFDLNYAGVIFGKEVYYDVEKGCIEVNKKELKDNRTKIKGDNDSKKYILNIYLTLMTRGIYGTYIYAVDDKLRGYLRDFFG
ncbi:DUF2075 domain-containing protein [Butyrivibrio sp. FCS014]|uniref:DUF2075 domain-containing protein n=1 Tax=Butyrivibrio sp. FCS014 TaxID=1408304 RepID=UPI00046721AA|nr:DUF2075 domain-containing protein [Butyrivibrio sp. FCS014]